MGRLINVRLDEARWRKARHLRRRGIVLSEVVREAIDQRFEASQRAAEPKDMTALLRRIYEAYPEPPGAVARGYDVHDRQEAAAAIRRRLRRRR